MQKTLVRVQLALVFACLTVTASQASASPESRDEIQREILKLEDVQSQAMLKGDVDTLSSIYADGIDWVQPDGEKMTKEQVLASHRASKLKYDSIKHFNIETEIYGNTVVLTGQSLSMVHYGDKVFDFPRRFTNVYVREDGRWRLVVHHVTEVSRKVGEK
jgi:ketosteroid isomerase-like protein